MVSLFTEKKLPIILFDLENGSFEIVHLSVSNLEASKILADACPYFSTHLILLLSALIIIVLIFILQLVSYILSVETNSSEKKSSYECGFEPFGEAHAPINIHFYLIGILYLIFDLELLFFYPWIFSTAESVTAFSAFFSFLILVGAGFVYEWKQGGLEWSF